MVKWLNGQVVKWEAEWCGAWGEVGLRIWRKGLWNGDARRALRALAHGVRLSPAVTLRMMDRLNLQMPTYGFWRHKLKPKKFLDYWREAPSKYSREECVLGTVFLVIIILGSLMVMQAVILHFTGTPRQ